MLIDQENITKLVPQRPPILMIDSLILQDKDSTVTHFEVREDNMLVRDGELMPEGMIENIAQTAASRAGYEYHIRSVTPPLGFIGAISKVNIHQLPKVGEVLKTTVTVKSEIFGITLIKGEIHLNDTLAAECEMKIVIANDA